MTLADELVAMANDYILGRVKLAAIDGLLHDHVDEWVELDETGTPEALLSGFIQVRIYDMAQGLAEDDLRRDVAGYLAEHKLVAPPVKQRATG